MEDLNKQMRERLNFLEKIEKDAKKYLDNAPEGQLITVNNHGFTQFYFRKSYKDKKRYMRKSEKRLIVSLCQKEYTRKVLRLVEKQRGVLEKTLKTYNDDELKSIFEKMNIGKKINIKPYDYPDDLYGEKWEEKMKLEKEKLMKKIPERYHIEYYNENSKIFTEKGERVRSKSEKIIADQLYKLNIPYVYELPLLLKGYGYKIPDFTILNKRLRKVFYLEHFGMMEDLIYLRRAFEKIMSYENNKIYPGNKLIMSFESSTNPLRTESVKQIIKEYFI